MKCTRRETHGSGAVFHLTGTGDLRSWRSWKLGERRTSHRYSVSSPKIQVSSRG